MSMNHSRVPLLTEDGTRLDWPGAQYEPRVDRKGAETKVTVNHVLKGATALADAVRGGKAKWQTELRCPRLLHSQNFESSDEHQVVEWSADAVDWENTYLLPGLVSVGPILIDSGELLSTANAPGEQSEAPTGALLARADVRRLKPLMQSLLVFRKDDGLGPGQMKVMEDTSSDDPCFKVFIAADIYTGIRWERDRHVAALIGAFAAMTHKESRMQPDGELWHHPVTREMRSRLLEHDSPVWDQDGFDCVYAATVFEPLLASETASEDGDDE